MPLLDANVVAGRTRNDKFQQGVSNVDDNSIAERNILLPYPRDPQATWVYYDCTVGVMLDSGIAVHNHLPQVNNTSDTLASCLFDDAGLDKLVKLGVNLKCRDQYADIVQRMGHSRYWFRVWGQALRVGQQVPIPGLKTIGGVPAIPYDKNPQWAFNRIAPGGNYSGVILWHAAWSLWYTTAVPPINNVIPAADPTAHISGVVQPPNQGIQAPYSQADDNSVRNAPTKVPATQNIIRG